MTTALLDQQISRLQALCPPIEAFAIGGSYGISQAPDDHSDLDFFLLLPSNGFLERIRQFPALLGEQNDLVAMRYRGFYPDFGFQYIYVFEGPRLVDYFLNSMETLSETPMARKDRIIKDTTGRYSEFLRGLPHSERLSHRSQVTAAAADLLIEVYKFRKVALRRDLLRLLHRLDRIRLLMLALDRMALCGSPYDSWGPDRWLRADLGAGYELQALATVPALERASIASAFAQISRRARDRVAGLTPLAGLTPAYLATLDQVLDDVMKVLDRIELPELFGDRI